MLSIYEIVSVAALILGGMMAYVEKRISTIHDAIEQKVKSQEKISEMIETNLKEDIRRLEAKLEFLIQLQIKRNSE